MSSFKTIFALIAILALGASAATMNDSSAAAFAAAQASANVHGQASGFAAAEASASASSNGYISNHISGSDNGNNGYYFEQSYGTRNPVQKKCRDRKTGEIRYLTSNVTYGRRGNYGVYTGESVSSASASAAARAETRGSNGFASASAEAAARAFANRV